VRRLPLSPLAAIFVVGGCYRYVPTAIDAVPVGETVRALLSTETRLVMHDSLGLDLRGLNGTLVGREDDRLLFQVRAASGSSAFGARPLYQRIAVSPRDVLRVDVKRVHGVKTGALVAAILAAATIMTIEAWAGRNPGTPEPPNGGPSERYGWW
jgi:hypothetical protein